MEGVTYQDPVGTGSAALSRVAQAAAFGVDIVFRSGAPRSTKMGCDRQMPDGSADGNPDNSGRGQERVWRAQRPGTENADIATSGSGGDRTPLIRPAERLELGAYSSDTGK